LLSLLNAKSGQNIAQCQAKNRLIHSLPSPTVNAYNFDPPGGRMRAARWLHICAALLLALSTNAVFAVQGHGNGHNKHEDQDDDRGRDRDDRDRDRDKHEKHEYRRGYNDHDRDEMRAWYRDHHDHLPPGLAKRDQLPPGLERQLEARGTLPPGLRKKMLRCPDDLERRLPPPPPDCRHELIGGHVVLVNVRTFAVVDVFHFEVGVR
jgi:Ni/Co efflux regulator RcnB